MFRSLEVFLGSPCLPRSGHKNGGRRLINRSYTSAPFKMTAQASYVPSHPELFVVEFLPGNFASRLVSLKVGFPRRDYAVSAWRFTVSETLVVRCRGDHHRRV